jgi:hypothetical protein
VLSKQGNKQSKVIEGWPVIIMGEMETSIIRIYQYAEYHILAPQLPQDRQSSSQAIA